MRPREKAIRELGHLDKTIQPCRLAVQRRSRVAAMLTVYFSDQSIREVDVAPNKYVQRGANDIAIFEDNIAAG